MIKAEMMALLNQCHVQDFILSKKDPTLSHVYILFSEHRDFLLQAGIDDAYLASHMDSTQTMVDVYDYIQSQELDYFANFGFVNLVSKH